MTSTASARILIVEDERLIRETLLAFIKAEGYSVVAVADGDRKSTRLNSSHIQKSRMPSSA